MQIPAQRQILIFIAIALLFGFVLLKSQAIDFQQHNLYIGKLRQLSEKDARLNQDILQARFSKLMYYDPINEELRELKNIQNYLESVPDFIDRRGQAKVKELLQKHIKLLEQKAKLSEEFKTQNATLKNSLSYFPIIMTNLVGQTRNPRLVASLNRLLRDVLIYNVFPDRELMRTIEERIETILEQNNKYNLAVNRADLEIAIAHAQVILHDLPKVNELIDKILNLPLRQRSKELTQTYELHYQQALRTANAYRFGLYLLSLILLIAIASYIIFKLRQSAAIIRRAEEKYHSIFDNSINGIFQTTPDGKFISANSALANIYGYNSPEELCASLSSVKTIYVQPRRREEFKALVAKKGAVADFESQVYRRDGRKIWISESARAVRDRQKNLLFYEGTVIDITARKQAEEFLRLEREKSERLLLNILPEMIAEQLKQSNNGLNPDNYEALIAEQFDQATILFADIVGFTPLSAKIPPKQLVYLLNQIFSQFDQLAQQYGLEKIKTIGDAYMVAGGLPEPREDHAEAIAEIALEMQQAIGRFKEKTGESLQIRIGINTGSVVAGVIGRKKFIYDLWGDAVNVASRMESSGVPGRIQVTAETYQLLQHKYELEKRGVIEIKGKGEMTTYWLIGKGLGIGD